MVVVGAVRRLGLKGKIPRPLVVVHSGNTTMTRFGCSFTNVARSVIRAPFGGYSAGLDKARRMAPRRDMYCTWRVCGYETVKMGSKIAARYRLSIGLVKLDAMIFPGCGTRPSCMRASDPFFTPSTCRSIHQMPGIPRMVQRSAFLGREPRGNHCRKRK